MIFWWLPLCDLFRNSSSCSPWLCHLLLKFLSEHLYWLCCFIVLENMQYKPVQPRSFEGTTATRNQMVRSKFICDDSEAFSKFLLSLSSLFCQFVDTSVWLISVTAWLTCFLCTLNKTLAHNRCFDASYKAFKHKPSYFQCILVQMNC